MIRLKVWYVTPCSLVDSFQPFGGTCYPYPQGTLKMASDWRFLQMLVTVHQTTSLHNEEDSNVHSHWCENLRSLINVKSPMCTVRHCTVKTYVLLFIPNLDTRFGGVFRSRSRPLRSRGKEGKLDGLLSQSGHSVIKKNLCPRRELNTNSSVVQSLSYLPYWLSLSGFIQLRIKLIMIVQLLLWILYCLSLRH
jgi:hypothetical protein